MTLEFSEFIRRLREFIKERDRSPVAAVTKLGSTPNHPPPELTTPAADGDRPHSAGEFNALALELFTLQFNRNIPYRRFCEARNASPDTVAHWTQIPSMPTSAFKELELTSLPAKERTTVFHSSGTTEQRPSRHFHNADSLAVYEASLWPWFAQNVVPDFRFPISDFRLIILTPPPAQATHSSLVHMFETVRRKLDAPVSAFVGCVATDGSWTLAFDATLAALECTSKLKTRNPKLILGTAFSFVHLLDFLADNNLRLQLPAGSRVMETGGYKGRSRNLSKAELHALISQRLGVPSSQIVSEYGMSELSSQAYDMEVRNAEMEQQSRCTPSGMLCGVRNEGKVFQFPPWARVQIISPETGREVGEGETGLIRVFDLANVFSVMAVQTEDLGVRRGGGFKLIGRTALTEPRGCSLMTA